MYSRGTRWPGSSPEAKKRKCALKKAESLRRDGILTVVIAFSSTGEQQSLALNFLLFGMVLRQELCFKYMCCLVSSCTEPVSLRRNDKEENTPALYIGFIVSIV